MAQVLSQEEIDALLQASSEGDLKEDGSIEGEEPVSGIQDYDFKRPNLITKDQLRTFTNMLDIFVRDTQTTLSLLMRGTVKFQMTSTEQQQYSGFMDSLPKVSHLAVFTADPLPGLIALEVNLALVFSLVDLRLGGTGEIETAIRQITDVETAIIEPVLTTITKNLQIRLRTIIGDNLNIKLMRYESNPEYLQAAPTDAPMVIIAFDMRIGETTGGVIHMCLPVPMIVDLLNAMIAKGAEVDSYYGKKDQEGFKHKILATLMEVPLNTNVTLGVAKILGKDLLKLSPGDILILDNSVGTQIPLAVGNRRLFKGIAGRKQRKLCFKINSRIIL